MQIYGSHAASFKYNHRAYVQLELFNAVSPQSL